MRTADMIASMLVAAGASAEFRLATIAAVILTVTAVSMNTLALSFLVLANGEFTRHGSSTIRSGR